MFLEGALEIRAKHNKLKKKQQHFKRAKETKPFREGQVVLTCGNNFLSMQAFSDGRMTAGNSQLLLMT
jgi:hypothetical protein